MIMIYAIEPATFKLDGGAMFGIIPKPLWSKKHPADGENRIELALRTLLIKEENHTILIDTGIGDYHADKFNQLFAITDTDSPLVRALRQAGVTPEEVTDIVISHLHFDHIGGLGTLKDEKMFPLFPQAKLHLHKEHFAYAQRPTRRDAGSFHQHIFLPLIEYYQQKNLINWLEDTEGTIIKEIGLKFKISKGHTPYMLHPYNDKFIYLADIVPTSNHLKLPWVMGYDMAPGVSVEDKEQILNFAYQNQLTVIFEHDPNYQGAILTKNDKEEIVIEQRLNSNDFTSNRRQASAYLLDFL